MAKIFLDTNYFIDAIHRHPEEEILDRLVGNSIFISPLSIHIYCYVYHIHLPNNILISQLNKFQIVELNDQILTRALTGPTQDMEDNIQLHSASEVNCDIFLTHDKKIHALQFFGKLKIESK